MEKEMGMEMALEMEKEMEIVNAPPSPHVVGPNPPHPSLPLPPHTRLVTLAVCGLHSPMVQHGGGGPTHKPHPYPNKGGNSPTFPRPLPPVSHGSGVAGLGPSLNVFCRPVPRTGWAARAYPGGARLLSPKTAVLVRPLQRFSSCGCTPWYGSVRSRGCGVRGWPAST